MPTTETIELMRAAGKKKREENPTTHLFRGAPAVRGWSKHQETVRDWTLCGIRYPNAPTTEDEKAVTCEFCTQLLS